jgi:hypothetical protein
MSVDLCGCHPEGVALSERGLGISFSSAEWGALWRFCQDLAPETTSLVEAPRCNDGDGLNTERAHALARVLRECGHELAAHPGRPARCARTSLR